MTVTRRAIRRRLYDEIPVLGFYGTADSVAAGNIVDTYAFQDTNLTQQHFKGAYIYRPDTTGDNIIKKAGNVTTASGTLAHTGANYTDTTDLVYEVVGVLHPDELNQCIQRANRYVYFETQWPLTVITDGDMSASGTTSWTASNTSHTKSTTAAKIFSGTQSSRVANTGADGYIQSGTIKLPTGSHVYISTIVHVDVGTAEFALWDVTNSVELAVVTTTEEGWVHLFWQGNIGTTTEEVALRLRGDEASADIYWDHAILIPTDWQRFFVPSWLDEQFKLLKLRQAAYGKSLGANAHDANSRYFRDWATPREFSLDPLHPDANPYALQFIRPYPMADMWVEAKRPFSDSYAMSTDAATSVIPEDLIVAFAKLELADLLIKRYPGEPRWEALKIEAEFDTRAESNSRPELPASPRRRNPPGRI